MQAVDNMALTVAEEIEELKRKITLLGKRKYVLIRRELHCTCLDGDKKAYKESSQWTMRQNKDVISQLRQENKILRAKLSKKMMVCIQPTWSMSLAMHFATGR